MLEILIMIMIMISYNVLQKHLISQKYKKYSPGKYALFLYLAISIRWISIMLDTGSEHFGGVGALKLLKTIDFTDRGGGGWGLSLHRLPI